LYNFQNIEELKTYEKDLYICFGVFPKIFKKDERIFENFEQNNCFVYSFSNIYQQVLLDYEFYFKPTVILKAKEVLSQQIFEKFDYKLKLNYH
jgi:hypothetical protein